MFLKTLTFLLFATLTNRVWAMPVAFEDSLGVMSYNQPDSQDWQVSYSITNRWGLGIDAVRDGMGEREQVYLLPRINLLVKRWNGSDYQANIYAYAGLGAGKRDAHVQGAYLFGGEVDFETRRIYFSAKGSTILASGFANSTVHQFRAGVSPYTADFESLQSWLIFQAQHYPEAVNEPWRVGPVLRFFIKNVFWEASVTTRGTWSLNFMIHF